MKNLSILFGALFVFVSQIQAEPRSAGFIRPMLIDTPPSGYVLMARLNKSLHNAVSKAEKKHGQKLFLTGIEVVNPGTSISDEFSIHKIRKLVPRGNWDTRGASGPMRPRPGYYLSGYYPPGSAGYAFYRSLEKGLKKFKFNVLLKNEVAAYGKVIGEELTVKSPLKLRMPAWGATLFNTMIRTRPLGR